MRIKLIVSFSGLILVPFILNAQNERKLIREGVKQYRDSSFTESEISFRGALSKDSTSMEANYDVAGSLYKQEKFEEAGDIYQKLTDRVESPNELADTWHNLGNSLFQKKEYEKSIEAYKNSLRIRPDDEETKYNLAYAQTMLKKQEQQKDQDNKDNKDNKDQDKNKDQNKDKKDNKDQDQNKDKEDKKDQQEENKDQKDEQKNEQPKPEPGDTQKEGMKKEDMQRMLQALEQQEKDLLQKIEKEKVKVPVKTEKNW